MVKASEIDSPEKLRDWLAFLPASLGEERARQASVTIAYRAAARVFPLAVRGMPVENKTGNKGDSTCLTVFRCLVMSSYLASKKQNGFDELIGSAMLAANNAAKSGERMDAYKAANASANALAAANMINPNLFSISAVADAESYFDHYVSDATALELGESLEGRSIMHQHDRRRDIWKGTSAKLTKTAIDWSPVIAWYEHLLDPKGRPLPVDMLREIATREDIDWAGGPPKALPVIGEIWGRYMGGVPHEKTHLDLARVTLYRFSLDQVALLMRAVQPPEDWKRLEDPELLSRLLADVEDLLEEIDLVCRSLEREGSKMQGGGTAQTYLESVRNELQKADETGVLRVSKLIEWVRLLDGQARREETRLEFHAVADPFAAVVDALGGLVREHFAHVLARLTNLREFRVEEGESHRGVLDLIRKALSVAAQGGGNDWRPLAPEDVAAFEDMIEGVDRMIRDMDRSEDEAEKSSLRKEVDFQMAKLVVSLRLFAHDARNAGAKGGKLTDDALKTEKRLLGLASFARRLLDYLGG